MKKTIMLKNLEILKKLKNHKENKQFKILFFIFIIFPSFIYGNTDENKIIDKFKNENTLSHQQQECKNWLLKNQDSPEYYDILMYYYIIEENSDVAIAFLHDSVAYLKNNHTKGEVYKKTAELAELKGNLSAARQDYQKAALLLDKPESYYALINAATLLYEQGMHIDSLRELSMIPDAIDDKEITVKKMSLEAMIKFAAGDYKNAESLFEFIFMKLKLTSYYLTALEYYLKLLKILNKDEDFKRVFEILKTQYESSPECIYTLIDNKVMPLPRPHLLFENIVSSINSVQSDDQTENHTFERTLNQNDNQSIDQNNNRQFIQTGSFTIRENAEYMVIDLEKQGFNAFYIEKIMNEEKYYSVITEMPDNYKSIDSFYEDLKTNGFNGFTITLTNFPEIQSE